MGDIVESRCRETFFGEHLLGGIQEQRTGVLDASLPGPALNHVGDCATGSQKRIGYSDTSWYICKNRRPAGGELMAASSTEVVEYTANPHLRHMRERCTTTIQKEAVS